MRDIMKQTIFNRLDSIEDKVGKMAHEIPYLHERLKAWQDGQLKDSYFAAYLARMIDDLARQ